jgi:hypothetical protein
MSNHEENIQDIFDRVRLDDAPDPQHRETLERRLLAALAAPRRRPSAYAEIGRTIMRSKITKIAAAAAVLIAIVGVGLWSSGPDTPGNMSSFTLLARASAAERMLFAGQRVVHIVSEITLYPTRQPDAAELLNNLESDTTVDRNVALIKSWLSQQWIPLYSLGADGRTQMHKLEIAPDTEGTVTVLDLVWYEPATRRFVRVLQTGNQVLFANAYDGGSVYLAQRAADGRLEVDREPVTGEFKVPDNPADFVGIAAGVTASVPGKHYPPIQDVATETLDDGTSVRIYTLGYVDLSGSIGTYFLFKVAADTDVINEMDCVVDGKTTRVHRRLAAETVDNPQYSWNLSELTADSDGQETATANVRTDKAAEVITISQMADRATSPVYIFAKTPSWAQEAIVYDLPDESSAPARLFAATYRGKDGRDLVLTQGESFNRYFGALLKEVPSGEEQVPWMYKSQNGFRVMHQSDTSTEMWWTEFALKSSGFEPKANRIGYILLSPAKTFLVLAINGPVSNQELQNLADGLIPADEYMPAPAQP